MEKINKKDRTMNRHAPIGSNTQALDTAEDGDAALPGAHIWTEVQDALMHRLTAADYMRWIADLRLIAEVDGEILIAARDKLAFDRVTADHKRLIQRLWREQDPKQRAIRLENWKSAHKDLRSLVDDPWASAGRVAPRHVPEPEADAEGPTPTSAAPEMTFETLITGPSNQLAFTAAARIADGQPTGTPITLLYGPQGTGKTHLLHALRISATRQGRTVTYVTAEEFLSAFVDGARSGDTRALKTRMRSASILLIDDLHRIAGKPKTETALFQNIREVTSMGGTVVLAGDEAPGDAKGFSPRMRGELKGSTAIEIGLPDTQMRRAIVEQLADHITPCFPAFALTEPQISRIVAGIRGPGRELCGAVWNLHMEAGFGETKPTDAMLERVIRRLEGEAREPSIDLVKKATMKVFDVNKIDLEGPCKAQAYVYPRQIAMYLCRKKTRKSYPQIGRSFGGRDHTTVLYSFRKVVKKLDGSTSSELARDIDKVAQTIVELQASGLN
jgi:chromosomal replication initiator protein